MKKTNYLLMLIVVLVMLTGCRFKLFDYKKASYSSEQKVAYEYWIDVIQKHYRDAYDFCDIDEVEFEPIDTNGYLYGVMKFKGKNMYDETKTFKVKCVAYINDEGNVATRFSGMLGDPREESDYDQKVLEEKQREEEKRQREQQYTENIYEGTEIYKPTDKGIEGTTAIDIRVLNSYYESREKDYSNYTYELMNANEDGTISYRIHDGNGNVIDNLDISREKLSLYSYNSVFDDMELVYSCD